jgi:DNA (cytosine-5)-methyltransferase 1
VTPLVQGDGDSGLTFLDCFCGAGGSSIGLSEAGFSLKLAANHWDRAIETHAANFRDAEHLCADVSNYDWRRAPRTVVGWFSPECTWHSPAGGRKRARQQLDLFEEHVPDDAGVRSRATAFDVIRAMEVHQYRAVIVENVTEFADWELFDWWLDGLRKVGKGYNVQTVCVSSAHIGGEGNPHAPQWRDRLYLVATQKGIPLPDVAPRPPAWCPVCDEVTPARQTWKKVTGRRVGKYGSQYVYTCGNGARCRHPRLRSTGRTWAPGSATGRDRWPRRPCGGSGSGWSCSRSRWWPRRTGRPGSGPGRGTCGRGPRWRPR